MPKYRARVQSAPAYHKNSATRRPKSQFIDDWRTLLERVCLEFEQSDEDPSSMTIYATRDATLRAAPDMPCVEVHKRLLQMTSPNAIKIRSLMQQFMDRQLCLVFCSDILGDVLRVPKTFDSDLEVQVMRQRAELYRQRLRHGFVYQADADVLRLMLRNHKKSNYRTIN